MQSETFIEHIIRNKIQFPNSHLKDEYFKAWKQVKRFRPDCCDGCGISIKIGYLIEASDGGMCGLCRECGDAYLDSIGEERL